MSKSASEHGRGLAGAAAPAAIRYGAKRLRLRPRRGSGRNRSSGSVHSASGVQPPASSSRRAPRGPYLWLFSVWIDCALARRRSGWPSTVNSTSRVATRCISIRDKHVVPARFVAEGVDRDVAVELAVDPVEQVEVERGGDARRDRHRRRSAARPASPGPCRSAAARRCRAMSRKWRSRSVALRGTKLPIVEPGKKPSLGRSAICVGKGERPGEVGLDRIDRQARESPRSTARGAFAQIIAEMSTGT